MANTTKTFRSKKEFAYEVLRENILTGQLEPGTRLIIDDLAKDLSVSPIPVREALQLLQSDGFVSIEPYVGARVKEIQVDLVQEVFELLSSLEVISSRAACQKMTDEDFETLESLIRKMDDEVEDLETWSKDNVQLHQYICDWAGMSLTQTLMERVVDHWDWLRRYYLEDVFVHRVRGAQKDHWELLEALQTRNPAHVTAVVEAHNQKALSSYLGFLDENPVPS
ncbi:MAG: GntR family transcriptional regulator [Chloroflexota bacterium]